MAKITRSKSEIIAENELVIRGYEKFNFSHMTTNKKFLRPDMYKIISNFEDFDINYIRGNECLTPVLFTCHPSALGIQRGMNEYNTFKVVEDNCTLSTTINVVINGKPETSKIKFFKQLNRLTKKRGKREHVFNSLSLDYTFTNLSEEFNSPKFAIENDLAVQTWPDILKLLQLDYVSKDGAIFEKIIPMTWKICTISAKGSFIDFRINFSSSCVWINIVFGSTTLWLIPPSDYNIRMFEQYLKDTSSSKEFLGNIVENCCRITLTAGQSFYIPAGWIFARLADEDSLMVSGNFLAVSLLETQLKIVELEDRLKTKNEFKYPFFSELMWYTLADIVKDVTGLSYIDNSKYKSMNIIKKSLLENTKKYCEKHRKNYMYITPYLKNEELMHNDGESNCFFKSNTHLTFSEDIVQMEKLYMWTDQEIKGYQCLLKYIKKHIKKMEKKVPYEIIKHEDLLVTFERILDLLLEKKQKKEVKEIDPAHISWITTLRTKANLARKRKIIERREMKRRFLENVRSKRNR